jgi:DNA-binding NtrC family response regulator
MPKSVLLVDDEHDIRVPLRRFLEAKGYLVREADSVAAALEAFRKERPDAAMVDFSLPDGDGMELLRQLKSADLSVPVIMLTGHGTIDLAVRAMQEGAEQFFTKPVELPTLLVVLERVLENQRNRQATQLRKSQVARRAVDPFVGESAAIRRLHDQARRVLASSVPVLIQGETGTGKGVLARWLHANGPRAEEPFVDLNCAGLQKELLESELFGHEKGSFTGAVASKPGLFEMANKGVLFLDEIGDVDLQVQAKLLKVVEDYRFRRVGDVRDRQVDVRLVAATHRDLARLVREEKFREDLLYRINAIPLVMPALRERGDDVRAIARGLLERIGPELGRAGVTLQEAALRRLEAYDWPGNIRQLRNSLERAVLLSEAQALPAEAFADLSGPGPSPPAGAGAQAAGSMEPATLLDVECRHIEHVLRRERGNVVRAAQLLGISRSALYEKIKKYSLQTPRAAEARQDP